MTKKPAAFLLLLLLGGGSGKGIYDYLNREDPVEKTEPRSNENINKTPEKEKIKILKLIEKNALPYENVDSQWGKLVEKVNSNTNKKKKFFGESVDKNKLIQGCQSQSNKEILVENKEKNEDYLQTAEGCIGTIREELGDEKALKAKSTDKSEDRESGKVKALILAKYGEDEASTDIALNKEIKEAQEKIKKTNDSKFGNKLTDGCKDVYQLGFKGTNDDIGKLANKFCTKPTNRDMIVWGGLAILDGKLDTEGDTKVKTAESDNVVKEVIKGDQDKKPKLQKGCQEQFQKLISDTTSVDSEDTEELQRIKNLCVLTNKEKLGQGQIEITNTSENTNKSTGEGKMESLEEQGKTSADLKEISNKYKKQKTQKETTEKNAGKELRAGCKSVQDKGYAGEDDADFKLAKTICIN